MSNVKDLGVYVDRLVRDAAKDAYVARVKSDAATADLSRAMRRLAAVCKKCGVNPADIRVGKLTALSLVPADFARREGWTGAES